MSLVSQIRAWWARQSACCLECGADVSEGSGFRVPGAGAYCSEAHALAHQTMAGI